MRWFRKKGEGSQGPSAPAPRPARPRPSPSEPGWRSYDLVAAEYDRTHAPHTAVVAADLLTLAGVAPGSRVLDVGCGSGRALAPANEKGAVAIGVDPSVGLLRIAGGGRVAAAEVINLPFREEQFDVAMCNFTLPYFAKLDTALFDVKRVMKYGARIAVSVWGAEEDDLTKTWRVLLEESIGRDILQAGIKDQMPWAEKLSDKWRLDTALRDAGFRPVDVEKRRYKFEMPLEDYITGKEIEVSGRYAKEMLGPALWESFRARIRDAYRDRFPETLVDFRDVLLAVARKPV